MQLGRELLQVAFRSLVVTVLIVALISVGQAQVMTSGSFQIESDSINFGGGRSTSTSYVQESTLGEIATGDGSSTNYRLKAGYQQMHESYIALSVISDVSLTPNLGLTGGVSNGSTDFVVTTDNRAGYSVTLKADNSPAMQSIVGNIPNFDPGTGQASFSFTTASNEAHFGFTPEGADIATRFKDNSALCGVGSSDTVDACWDMVSSTPVEIVHRSSSNQPSGSTTTLKFRVGIGAGASVVSGLYTATSTVTALTL